MTTPRYSETRDRPLTTDDLLQERVTDLIGRANVRQHWFLFLDADGVQLPMLIPLDGLPLRPTDDLGWLADRLRDTMEELGAASIVLVLERYADAAFTVSDMAWARALHAAFDDAAVALRAVFVCHRTGVRRMAADEYRYVE